MEANRTLEVPCESPQTAGYRMHGSDEPLTALGRNQPPPAYPSRSRQRLLAGWFLAFLVVQRQRGGESGRAASIGVEGAITTGTWLAGTRMTCVGSR